MPQQPHREYESSLRGGAGGAGGSGACDLGKEGQYQKLLPDEVGSAAPPPGQALKCLSGVLANEKTDWSYHG